jgi:hypothetical protein
MAYGEIMANGDTLRTSVDDEKDEIPFQTADAEDFNVEQEDEDDSPLGLPKSAFTPINFSTSARRIIDLFRSYREDKDLDPRPSFQRGYVWDKNKATKLIESILLHVPLPLVYTAEEESGLEVVIDGQQRLTTCFSFIDGFFPLSKKDEERQQRGEVVKRRPFKLGKMKILAHLEKLGYAELPSDLKKTINNFNIQIIKISKESHPDVKFEIFERLNTGSVALADQEIRNCIYRGPYNDLLCNLANNVTFQKILGISDSAIRMQDVELVLRFMAFNEVTYLNYNEKMRGFLNNHMRDKRQISDENQEKYRKEFSHAVDLSFSVFGEKAFRRYSEGNDNVHSGKWERAVNKAVYDVIMFWFARYEKRDVIENKDRIREKYIEMCVHDRDFNDAITLGTADAGRVKTRFKKWGDALEEIIKKRDNQARLYSFAEKSALYESNKTCRICLQQIAHIDDCEVDHIVPFSQGGDTNIENAQLAHRFCNRSKGNR